MSKKLIRVWMVVNVQTGEVLHESRCITACYKVHFHLIYRLKTLVDCPYHLDCKFVEEEDSNAVNQ